MKVEFGLITSPVGFSAETVYTLESELRSNPQLYMMDELAETKNIHRGRFYMGEGDQHCFFTDSIQHTVTTLCFNGVQKLIDGKEYEFMHWMCSDSIIFTPNEKSIEIVRKPWNNNETMVEKTNMVVLDKKRLLPALYYCGCRYLTFLTETLPHKGYEKTAQVIQPFADSTLSALRQHHYL